VTSGIRVGTPAVTTRGFGQSEVADLANWMCDIIDDLGNEDVVNQVRAKVSEVCKRLPVYG
jgi:glycine hydroxymethyltransferase